MSEFFKITSIQLEDDIIKLHIPAVLEYSRQGDYLVGVCEELNIDAIGENLEELIEDFQEWLEFSWKEYAEEDDNKLNLGAIRLKNTLLKMARK